MWLLTLLACVKTDPVLDTAAPPDAPVAGFTWEAGCDLVPVVAFTATSEASSGELRQLLWQFGDGTSGFGDLVIHRYDAPGAYQVDHTAVDDAGRERQVRAQVDAVACLVVTGAEVTVEDGAADPVAVIANLGADEVAYVDFLIDIVDDAGTVLVADLPGSRAAVPPGFVVVARPADPWPCLDQCDAVAGMQVRLERTFWFPIE